MSGILLFLFVLTGIFVALLIDHYLPTTQLTG